MPRQIIPLLVAAVSLTLAFGVARPAVSHPHHNHSQPPSEDHVRDLEPQGESDAPPLDTVDRLDIQVPVSPLVSRLLDDPILTDEERTELRIFLGRWDDLDEASLPPEYRARLALLRYELNHPSLLDAEVDPLLRARAALLRGEPEQVAVILGPMEGPQAAVMRAEAYDWLGQSEQAVRTLSGWRGLIGESMSAADHTAVARMSTLLANREGRPSRDFQQAVERYSRAYGEVDPTYWPAHVAEAELLMEKGSRASAASAAADALSLNARSGEAWYVLGMLHASSFNFDAAEQCAQQLRKINPDHLLADLLMAHSFLTQKDPYSARTIVDEALQRYPAQRELHALAAAVEAMSYRGTEMRRRLSHFAELSPRHPLAWYTVGRYLSFARQYPDAESALREAIDLRPAWPDPHIELGLLLMQSGDEPGARDALRVATSLDQFNRRAANQLKLVEELLDYEQIETTHFIIKYREGIDEVLARDMALQVERIYTEVTEAFEHRPARKTLIEIMPDDQWFAVRITGMPTIWTIGACTGDVIAITPPRVGHRQRGTYDWPRVIQHEFVHTVTLDQTANRIPHWFTEACAVALEPGDRDFRTYQLLATKLLADDLFDLVDINWAFVRPQRPEDRPLAYAQAHWMYEYIVERWGNTAIVALMREYRDGHTDVVAFRNVTGQSADEFLDGFKAWAGEQVEAWGFQQLPENDELRAFLTSSRRDPADLDRWLERYPNQADLLRLAAREATSGEVIDLDAAERAVLRYQAARPMDPWSHRTLLELALRRGEPIAATTSLEALDRTEQSSSVWARQLADIYQSHGSFDNAARSIERAIEREPYNANLREKAATIALQGENLPLAAHHVRAMSILEPQVARHHVRLAVLHHRLGETDHAHTAAMRARAINPAIALPAVIDPANR